MHIAVYCSANNSIADEYKLIGKQLGEWIARNGHSLVFGGATGGLMTEVSQAAFNGGSKVIGIVPVRIDKSGRHSPYCTETIIVNNMNERKQQMKEQADCFICLPGSYGTLDEMFDVIASGTVGEHQKPIYILNYKDFYSPLMEEIQQMKSLSFIPEREQYKPNFVNTLDELYSII